MSASPRLNASPLRQSRLEAFHPMPSRTIDGLQPGALAGFWGLPFELQYAILALACGPPTLPRYTLAGHSTDCTTTMLRLLYSGRRFSALVTPLLYRHARLVRPSALRAFSERLATQPELGLLVKSLHIGEDKPLPELTWPIRTVDGRGHLDESTEDEDCGAEDWLDGEEPNRIMQEPKRILFRLNHGDEGSWRGCWRHDHHIRPPGEAEGMEGALDKAFQAASRDLDVNLSYRKRDFSGSAIESNAWRVRIYELQAAVELYYLEARRRQSSAKIKRGEAEAVVEYPSLRISDEPQAEGSSIFTLSRRQLLERMESAGAPTDRFGHPFNVARLALGWQASAASGQPNHATSSHQGAGAQAHRLDYQAMARLAPTSASQTGVLPSLESLSTTRAGRHIGLAQDILSLTPRLRSLSLTGYFDLCLAGTAPLRLLQSVTIGPPGSKSAVPVELTYPVFQTVKRLRICHAFLKKEAAECLSGGSGALPQLEEVQWVMPFTYGWWERLSFSAVNAIEQLAQAAPRACAASEAEMSEAEPLSPKRIPSPCKADGSSAAESEDSFDDGSQESSGVENSQSSEDDASEEEEIPPARLPLRARHGTYIEACLDPADVAAVLRAAPSEAVAGAWRAGETVAGQRHRLRVSPNEYREREDGGEDWGWREIQQDLYEEGRRWWERG